ncbi:MAG: hypothetical protein AABZ20_01410 [candidate division NC10 bacterium]
MDPEIRAEFEETHRRIDAVAERMAAQVQLAAEQTRRHFDVVAEGMRSDVRLVAEGVTALADRVDRVEHNLRQEIRETRRDVTALLTASYTDLDRRMRHLEGDR